MANITLDRKAIFPVAVWWQGLDNIGQWVRERGVNVLWWDKQIYGNAGDWETLHQKVEILRQQGYPVWVIRQPAKYLVPDQLDWSFDQKWKSHIYAFDLDDEFEGKIPGGSLWGSWQPIIDYVKGRSSEVKAQFPDIPVIANFNGSFVKADMQAAYSAVINAGIDIISSDNYPCAAQQVDDKGNFLYPDIVEGYVGAGRFFKQWFPNKPVWVYVDCCNQDISPKGADGYCPPWKFVGSRAPTPTEVTNMVTAMKSYKADGLAWFPQSHNGATMDATDPALIPTMVQLSKSLQPNISVSNGVQPQPPVVKPPVSNPVATPDKTKAVKMPVACTLSRDLKHNRWAVTITATKQTLLITDPAAIAAIDAAVEKATPVK